MKGLKSRMPSAGRVWIVATTVALSLSATEVLAQNSGCTDIQTQLLERKSIADRLSPGGNKKLDPKTACTSFNQLVQNGTKLIAWTDANKDWCQIPDSFVESIKADHVKAQEIRGKACGMAAKQAEMERQAKQGGGSGGLLGGNGLSGSTSLPQGAL